MSQIVVYAAGTWDLLHIGHLNIIKAAKALGDVLIIGVKTDELVHLQRGHYPLMSYDDRVAVLRSCRYVDMVVPQETVDKDALLEQMNVDVLVVGSDYWEKKVLGHKWMVEHGRKVFYLPYTKSRSSTMIRQALKRYYAEQEESGMPQPPLAGIAPEPKATTTENP